MPILHPADYTSPLQFINNWKRISRGEEPEVADSNLGNFLVSLLQVLDTASYDANQLQRSSHIDNCGNLGINFPGLNPEFLARQGIASSDTFTDDDSIGPLKFLLDQLLDLSTEMVSRDTLEAEARRLLVDGTLGVRFVSGPMFLPNHILEYVDTIPSWYSLRHHTLSFHGDYPWGDEYASQLFARLPENIKRVGEEDSGMLYRIPTIDGFVAMRQDTPDPSVGAATVAGAPKRLVKYLHQRGLLDVDEGDLYSVRLLVIPNIYNRFMTTFSHRSDSTIFPNSALLPRTMVQYVMGRLSVRYASALGWRGTPELQLITGRNV